MSISSDGPQVISRDPAYTRALTARLRNRLVAACLAGVALALPFLGTRALATPPEGAEGVILGRVALTSDLQLAGTGTGEAVVQRITIAPGGTSGWHSHPGSVVVAVVTGTVTLYNGDDPSCQGQDVSAGSGFIEAGGHVHIARNEGATPFEVIATYLDVPVGGSPRDDAANPGNCAF